MAMQHKKKKNAPPKGMLAAAVAADPSKQVQNNSYDLPPLWYVDIDDMPAVAKQYADVGILFVRRTLQVGPLRHAVGVIV